MIALPGAVHVARCYLVYRECNRLCVRPLGSMSDTFFRLDLVMKILFVPFTLIQGYIEVASHQKIKSTQNWQTGGLPSAN